ncbi:hypothetical protein BDA99DRAFT_592358 [Phascolomyces articulosus]|uniref:F-box domain-containing protein n=1 Tax=Phascolomyces articulosus TaxID=60185 RepID=A0AAD5JN49_9FUNG|nr:hypothetical protein BDA99DRAFT_592358 [Phascolomyces articulosus]
MKSHSQDPYVAFLNKFSFDIITQIFSYLNQRDCLNCMKVCRTWYNDIPQYTAENWRTLRISSQEVIHGLINQRLLRCLGNHVKNVILITMNQDKVYTILQILQKSGCHGIESLEFFSCSVNPTIKDQIKFSYLLGKVASFKLTHLKMIRMNWSFVLLSILVACPHLTHFTFSPNYRHDGDAEDIELAEATQFDLREKVLERLVYLNIEAKIPSLDYQVQDIIKKCPNLRYYIGTAAGQPGALESLRRKAISLGYLMKWCPKLVYYVGDCTYYYNYHPQKNEFLLPSSTSTTTNDNSDDIYLQQYPFYHLALCDHDNYDENIGYLNKYQDTLTHIKLVGYPNHDEDSPSSYSYISVLNRIQTPHLRILHIEHVDFDLNSSISLLNTCHATIQEIYLGAITKITGNTIQYLDKSMIQRLKILPRLCTLTLNHIQLTEPDETTSMMLLERLPSLENLNIQEKSSLILSVQAVSLIKDHIKELKLKDPHYPANQIIPPETIDTLVSSGTLLETLEFNLKNVPYQLLFSVARLPALKSLNVYWIESSLLWNRSKNHKEEEREHEKNLLQFIHLLLRRCSPHQDCSTTSSSSLTVVHNKHSNAIPSTIQQPPSNIERLILYCVPSLSFDMLDALGDLPCLNQLVLAINRGSSLCRISTTCTTVTSTDATFDNAVSPKEYQNEMMNIDLQGLMSLLRKSRRLKSLTFVGAQSSGARTPSEIIKAFYYKQEWIHDPLRQYNITFMWINKNVLFSVEDIVIKKC